MDTITIALPDRPVMTVHKGWTPSKKHGNVNKWVLPVDQHHTEAKTLSRKGKSSAASPSENATSPVSQLTPTTNPQRIGQRFEFINDATEPLHTKDASVRKLVRSHVMKEVARERREQKKTKLKETDSKREEAKRAEEYRLPSERRIEGGSGDSIELAPPAQHQSTPSPPFDQEVEYHFPDIPRKSLASIRRLAFLYFTQLGSAMFPMEFHLAYQPPWQLLVLDISMTDDAVFQALLYCAAVTSTLAEGKKDSHDITVQMGLTIELINKRLDGGMRVADGMLGAVSCLAMGEALRGNFDNWAVHMTGLKKMVEMRGGISELHFYLQMKLYRADLVGSIDLVTRPFFHFDESHPPTIYSNTSSPAFNALLDSSTAPMDLQIILPRFTDVLKRLRDFSRIIEQTLLTPDTKLDSKELVEACFSLQYQLLSSAFIVEEDLGDGLIKGNDELGESFLLGAIIYMKEILRSTTCSATDSNRIVSKLKTSLNLVNTSQTAPSSSSLLLWLLVMGGLASVKDSMDRTLFVTHLVRLRRKFDFSGWQDVKEGLERVLWIGKVLDEAGNLLWEEVDVAGRALGL